MTNDNTTLDQQQTDAALPVAVTNASDSAGIEVPTSTAPQLSVPAHPHHNLVHGAIVAIESLIRQLEANISEECRDAIDHMHSAVIKLKNKL